MFFISDTLFGTVSEIDGNNKRTGSCFGTPGLQPFPAGGRLSAKNGVLFP